MARAVRVCDPNFLLYFLRPNGTAKCTCIHLELLPLKSTPLLKCIQKKRLWFFMTTCRLKPHESNPLQFDDKNTEEVKTKLYFVVIKKSNINIITFECI